MCHRAEQGVSECSVVGVLAPERCDLRGRSALSPARSASAGEASAPSGAVRPTTFADVVVQAKKPDGSAFRMVGMATRGASSAYSHGYRNTIKRT